LPGELVVDPFCGSGSTMVAAVKEGREAYGCDVSPEAVDIARKRLENVSR
jgi:site-specific DNA-methyltransferase (adenine-specific)